MSTNAKLLVATVVLLALSVWSYSDTISRGDRFARGQKLLQNLNPDEVATIEIVDGEDTVTLQRQGEEFTIAENHDFPARNDAVNRFLRDLLDISLAKEIGTGAGLEEELGIEPMTDSTTEIRLRSASDQEMVHLRLGSSIEDGTGRYAQRRDQAGAPIYLTSDSAFLSTRADSFIEKEIVNHSQTAVRRVAGPDFLIEPEGEGDPLKLAAVPNGKKEKASETNKLKSILSRLSFDRALLADDEAVRDLVFDQILEVDLDDDTSYLIAHATDGDTHYLTIRGRSDVGRVEITLETPEEELKEKADKLTRADEIDQFNEFNDSWVYEISSFTGEKLALRKADLVEDDS